MSSNVSKNTASVYDNLAYAFDKVVYLKGNPVLSSEQNLSQELLELLIQKSTAHMPSGWLSFRPSYTSEDLDNAFYTQDPNQSKPEVALVNGWPIYVTNTKTTLKHINKIELNDAELRSGSRVDGVFLEVWRAYVTAQDSTDLSKPQNIGQLNTIYGIEMYDSDLGWAVGDKGTILKTLDGGVTWVSKETPIPVKIKKTSFYNQSVGYAIADKGYVIKTTNGGESWLILTTPVIDNLNDITVIDASNVVAVGDNGTVIKSTDGTNFTLIKSISGITSNFNAVHFYDNRIGWAVGDNGTFAITVNGGLSWDKQTVTNVRTGLTVTANFNSVAFFNMDDGVVVGDNGTVLKTSDGGYHFVDISDRIWDGTEYKSLTQLYPTETNNLNKVFVRKEFPHTFEISLYAPSRNYFRNVVYKIAPTEYPDSLVLEFQGTLDYQQYLHVLPLDDYATAEDLATAVNAILNPYSPEDVALPVDERQKVRVFTCVVNFAPAAQPSDFRPTSGTVPVTGSSSITFSVEDKVWAVGDDGRILKSSNSASKWEEIPNSIGFDLYDVNFVQDNKGWIVGTEGSVILYDPANIVEDFEIQDTDLSLKVKGRIYPEGNILAETEDYLEDDIIDRDLGVETSQRTQIQYRIRVVDGIDPFNYSDAGLGANYVYSLGPNEAYTDSGYYTYESMGSINGDYGLWRARCRGTVDGYTWAIPMFMVARRNASPFDPDTNINGYTDYDLRAIRPDGLTYEDISAGDITDLRKKINIHSYSHLLEKNFDLLLNNQLKTKISSRDEKGTQYGTSIMMSDVYTGITDISNLVQGNVTSEVEVVEETRQLDPNSETPLTDADYTFGPSTDSIYMSDVAYHEVKSILNGVETSRMIPGSFEGLGTSTIRFVIGEYTPLENEQYLIKVTRMRYTKRGLTRVPVEPLGIKYIPDTEANSLFYRGIDSNGDTAVIEYLTERVTGYKDYTVLFSGNLVPSDKDSQDLYKSTDIFDQSSLIHKRSLIKYDGQQFRGSQVEYHYFFKTTDYTRQISIPKNINGYGVIGVKSVRDADSLIEYAISSDYSSFETVYSDTPNLDGSYDVTQMRININPAYTIPVNKVVEVIIEVTYTDSTGNTDFSFTVANKGPVQEAYRTSFSCNFNIGSKGIDAVYKGVLYRVTVTGGTQRYIDIDLGDASGEFSDLLNGQVMGLSSYRTSEKLYQPYVWYKQTGSDVYKTYPVGTVEEITAGVGGLGTSQVRIYMDSRVPLLDGTVYIPMLVKQATFGETEDSKAYVFYKYRPYQTVDSLPSELVLEILNVPDFVYISNLGTGGSNRIKKEPYENPVEHIPVNDDTVINDNIFTNVDSLSFTNFSIDTGLVKIPAYISRKIGDDITLSSPNNVGDRLGRAFYTTCSIDFKFQTESLQHSVPRKVFVPMLARVRSDVVSPFKRGEIVMLVVSKAFKARPSNEVGFYEDDNTEYSPGYFEESNSAVGVYRLTNYPTVRI